MLANKKSLLAMSIAASLALTGCFSDNDNNVKVDPPTPPTPTEPVVVAPDAPTALALVVNANVVDRNSLDVVPAMVTFLESGVASENIVDVDGEMLTTVDATDGSVAFTKKDGSEITQVTVNVTAEGYIGKSFVVSLAAEDGVSIVNSLLALSPSNGGGVATEVVPVTLNDDGSSAEPIVAETAGKSGASANVPAGVILRDADGNAVTGAVSVSVSGADASTGAASALVPEGLNSAGAANLDKPVGVANILMADSTGKKVKQFSDPISVSMAIPATTMLNGEVIKTGDMLSLKSHDEDTGVWTSEENMVTVGALNAESQTYTGTFETNHLTFFASTTSVGVCTNSIGITTSGDAVPATGLYVSMSSSDATASGFIPAGSTTSQLVSAANASLFGISAGAKANVRVYDADNQPWFQSDGEVDICGTVPATLANPVQRVSENFTVSAVCSNDATQTIDMSNAVVRYSLGSKSKSLATSQGGGVFTLSNLALADADNPVAYTLFINPRVALANGTKSATVDITADGTDESLAEPLQVTCQTTTGG
ncbi:hypothetical protein PSECIP111951_00725 [Pseudoalteromonas holothuriae]|uniref:Uncharacterized protein n=1 Tax=Pseudoalteromonas holothuriae TaxID=2963714 RepID=A0ABN8UHE9_9GAMM|nr:hypothetical protein [Pseudoalteromonas sp. CIP111951]CAH9052967.1 hypothetical protein PSECIP111951_00725 [Pseudoalteromonas sp. CIP111951]